MTSHMGIAYLDGINPSVVWESKNRNWKTDLAFNEVVTAWDWTRGNLKERWQFIVPKLPHQVTGHQMRCVDIDGDGKDEIVPYGFAVDDDGTLKYGLWDQDIYHGDRFFIGDLDPARPGLEYYGIQQGYSESGMQWDYLDANTGKLLLSQHDPADHDMGRGAVYDLDPRFDGYELYTFVDGLYNVSGQKTSTKLPATYPNIRLWWDGDLGSEILDKTRLTKWNYLTSSEQRLYTASGVLDLPRNVPAFFGDILGDWREEFIYESSDHESLKVYTTPYPTDTRLFCLAQDPEYRNGMATKGYQQSLMTDFFLGFNMQQPPIPAIQRASVYWKGNKSGDWDKQTENWIDDKNAPAKYKDGDTVMFDIAGSSAEDIDLKEDLAPAKIWLMVPGHKYYKITGTGQFKGSMSLIKGLAGTVTINGNQRFTGPTDVEEGTLVVNGRYQSPVTVKSKGRIGGGGILSGGLIMNPGLNFDGGSIMPGYGHGPDSIASLTVQGSLRLPGNNNLLFDIDATKGPVNDSLIVDGDLKLEGKTRFYVDFKDSVFKPGTYTLVTATGKLDAKVDSLQLFGAFGERKSLQIAGNKIQLVVLSSRPAATVIWTGTTGSIWDFEKTNFDLNGTSTYYRSKDSVLFDENATQKDISLDADIYTKGLMFKGGNYSLSGAGDIGGEGGIHMTGDTTSLSILMENNSYTGNTTIEGGRFTIGKLDLVGMPSSLGTGDSATGNLVVSNSNFTIQGRNTTNRGLYLNGADTINIPAEDQYTIFTGKITMNGSLTKTGPGSIYMVGPKDFKGLVDIKEGIVNLRGMDGNVGGLGSGDLTLEDARLNYQDVRGSEDIMTNIYVPAGKIATIQADGRSTMKGALTGAGTLNFITTYVRTDLKGNWSAFKGTINILGSDFRIGNSSGYGNATLDLKEGKMYTMSGSSNKTTIGALNGDEGTSMSSGTWTVGSNDLNARYEGTISSQAIIKVGTGVWVLTGDNTYTGGTIVTAGKLLANNLTGSATGTGDVNVGSAGTIGGTGSIQGAVTMEAGAKIEAGENGKGMLTVNNDVLLPKGAILVAMINHSNKAANMLKVTGTLTLGGTLKVEELGDGGFQPGDQFQIIQSGTTIGGFSKIEPTDPGKGLLWEFSKQTGILKVVGDPSQVFNLPEDNFRVSANDETCISSDNGSISVQATKALSYAAVLNGDEAHPLNFTHDQPLMITELKAGDYTLDLTVPDQPSFNRHYQLTIHEPEPLSVYSTVNTADRQLTLTLRGADTTGYLITLNGITTLTKKSSVVLNLRQGSNHVEAQTTKDCQGVFKRDISLGQGHLVYPNPVIDHVTIDMAGDPSATAEVFIYNLNGQQAYKGVQAVTGGKINLQLARLAAGSYLVKVQTNQSAFIYKIIKK